MIEALPTQPLTPAHELVCGVSIDGGSPEIVRFAQSSDERDTTWQQNALRNAMTARSIQRLAPGKHTLVLWGIDPSVSISAVLIQSAK